jgi:hypothetical protein
MIKMKKKHFIERKVQFAWKKLKRGSQFKSDTGQIVTVLSSGSWNPEEGPDFLNAKFAIDGVELVGDVEIHIAASDWEKHGHDKDSRYKNVKLHVVMENDSKKKSLMPIIVMPDLPPSHKNFSEQSKFGLGACAKVFSGVADDIFYDFLRDAGIERFKEKSTEAVPGIISSGFDNALMKKTFVALGYKKNKDNFADLFERVQQHEESGNPDSLEAIIWGESGLLPDPTTNNVAPEMKQYARKLWDKWWKKRLSNQMPIKWIKAGVRPLNSPERRIAGLCAILRSSGWNLSKKILSLMRSNPSPGKFSAALLALFETDNEIWKSWTNFRDKRNLNAALIGKMRALDIIINVVLPFLHAKFAISKDIASSLFCEETYCVLPRPQDNIKIKTSINKWFFPPSRAKMVIKDAPSAIGAMHIMKKFCDKCFGDCPECLILKSLTAQWKKRSLKI